MSRITSDRRIEYAGSVHDEREIEAVVEVLRAGPTALRIGKNVKAMEQRVAELGFHKGTWTVARPAADSTVF